MLWKEEIRRIVSLWQSGGAYAVNAFIIDPNNNIQLVQTAGAAVLSVPSNELYAAMQTGACDAGITSSTSLAVSKSS